MTRVLTSRMSHLLISTVTALALALSTALLASATPPDNLAGPSVPGREAAQSTPAGERGNVPLDEAEVARKARAKKDQLRQRGTDAKLLAAFADGRVYNVIEAVNIRSCAGTGCSILTTKFAGDDLENIATSGTVNADGFTWIEVIYGYSGNTDPCATNTQRGWVIVDPLVGGNPFVLSGPLNIRMSACSGSIITSVPAGTQLAFCQGDNQWGSPPKWYEVFVPGGGGSCGWVDGWDFTDVR